MSAEKTDGGVQTAKMKKSWFKRPGVWIAAAAVLIVLMIAFRLALPQIICTSIEKITPQITGGKASLEDISLSLIGGRVEITGLKIGNPEGFSSENVLTVGSAVFDIDVGSLFSEKVRIEEITVKEVDFYMEQTLSSNNLLTLNRNVQSFAGTDKKESPDKKDAPAGPADKSQAKKLQIDRIDISSVRVNIVVNSVTAPMPMPPVRMEKLGTAPEGITGTEVFAKVMDEMIPNAVNAASGELMKSGQKFLDKSSDFLNGLKDKF